MARQDRRHLGPEGLREGGGGAHAVGQQHPAAVEEPGDPLAAGLVEGEALATVHEHEVVVEELVVEGVELRGGVIDADARLAGGCTQDGGERRRRRVAHARVLELADRQLATLDAVGRPSLVGGQGGEEGVFALEFPVRGVGEHVGADGERCLHLAAHRGGQAAARLAAELPEAGEARHAGLRVVEIGGRGVDQAGAAAVVDPHERTMQLRRHDLLGMPGRMLRRQEVQPVLGLREDLADELPQPAVELAARRTAGLREDEAAVVDVATQPRAGVGTEVEGILAREPEHGGLLEVVEPRGGHVDHVPGEARGIVALPAALDVFHEVGDVMAVAVPIVVGAVAALGDDHRPAALREKKEREARGDD